MKRKRKRKRKRNEFVKIKPKNKNRKIIYDKGELLKKLNENDIKQYDKFKSSVFTTEQVIFIFGNVTVVKHMKFIKKLLKTYIIDIAIEAKKKNITCRDVVKTRKNDKIIKSFY